MTNEKYQHVQDCLLSIAEMVIGLDLDRFLARIEQAESIGPIVDPTLYRRASKDLSEIKELATSLNHFRKIAWTIHSAQLIRWNK